MMPDYKAMFDFFEKDVFVPEAAMRYQGVIAYMGGYDALRKLGKKLMRINGYRRARTLPLNEVVATAAAALRCHANGTNSYSMLTGGSVKKRTYEQNGCLTTICFAVVLEEHAVVSVDVAQAQAYRTTPACAWPELRPWRYGGDPPENKIRAWAEARRPYRDLFDEAT